MRNTIAFACFIALVSTCSLAQEAAVATPDSSSSPVAYVYVQRPTHIDGFAAAANGKLTPVPGSPFANTNVNYMSITKKYLFGESQDQRYITTYAINSKGSLSKVATLDEGPFATNSGYADTQVDSTGSDLYYYTGNTYSSYRMESNGELQYLGDSGGDVDGITQGNTAYLKMEGTNKYAFNGFCQEDNFNLSSINIYKRESNGALTYFGQSNDVPAPGSNGHPFCASILATDSSNHVAVALQRIDHQYGDNGFLGGPYFLATYTADSNGNLTTKSTAENMPEATFVGTFAPNTMSIDPTNKFLAVGAGQGGATGFAIYHFNGSSPITKYSGVLQPKIGVGSFAWDKAHHLYVIGGGYLFVYTVTESEIKQAPGSPYSIPETNNVKVLDLQ